MGIVKGRSTSAGRPKRRAAAPLKGAGRAAIKRTLLAPIVPGEILYGPGEIEAFDGRETRQMLVSNTGDRPIQVGSHCHFFEVNRALTFEREQAFGFRLCIPAGTALRFEPGEQKRVTLVALAGARRAHGINGLTEGAVDDPSTKTAALHRAIERGFAGRGERP
jgi:urease beta subunit